MPFLFLLAFCLFLALLRRHCRRRRTPAPPPAPAIWSGLILATNDSHPSQPPARLRQARRQAEKCFWLQSVRTRRRALRENGRPVRALAHSQQGLQPERKDTHRARRAIPLEDRPVSRITTASSNSSPTSIATAPSSSAAPSMRAASWSSCSASSMLPRCPRAPSGQRWLRQTLARRLPRSPGPTPPRHPSQQFPTSESSRRQRTADRSPRHASPSAPTILAPARGNTRGISTRSSRGRERLTPRHTSFQKIVLCH